LERLAESDFQEMRRTVRTGGKLSSEEDIPTRVGSYDYEEELKKVEETAKKLLGDSPRFKEFQDLVKKEQLAVRKIKEPAEEHH